MATTTTTAAAAAAFPSSIPIAPPTTVSSLRPFLRLHHHHTPRLPRLACSTTSTTPLSHATPHHPPTFVNFFHDAWPYIRAHSGSTIVVAVSSSVVGGPCLGGVLQDVALLHGLGIRVVLVPGTQLQIDGILEGKGRKGEYVGQYRITDQVALDAAMEASGRVVGEIEAKVSPGPPAWNVGRRHGDNGRWHQLGVSVATGNFLAAKRRGVVDGIDYGATGEVKRIDVTRIQELIDSDCIVVLSNLGYSSTGQVLNCYTYEVATACALAIEADKLICIVDGQILDDSDQLVRFMTIQDADSLIRKRAKNSETAVKYVKAVGEEAIGSPVDCNYGNVCPAWNGKGLREKFNCIFRNGVGFDYRNGFDSGLAIGVEERLSRSNGYLSELAAAVFVCRGGVRRAHLIDGFLGGALLLELFTRDGVGTMIASDVYEETRMAKVSDIHGMKQVIKSSEESGAPV